jgi:hypothetical protein
VYAADHPLPHFHLRKAGRSVSVSLNGNILEGSVAPGDLRAIRLWVERHRSEILAAFNDVQQGRLPKWIG